MIQNFDKNDRRILKFPAINPCDDISPATLLKSLIEISQNISIFQTKIFPTQRKNARVILRQVSILSIFFDEIRETGIPISLTLCLLELHVAFQKIQFLLEDCTREGARIWMLMKSQFVATQFKTFLHTISTVLDVLPLNSIAISLEVKELVEMLSRQARNAKMDVELRDEIAMNRVIQLLDHFEQNQFVMKKILSHLNIKTWTACHKEIKFLEEEIRTAYSNGDQRELSLLNGLVGFLSYCRGTLFEEFDFSSLDQSNSINSNLQIFGCLNQEDFHCPISLELMTEPVTISTGQTYDRVSIEKWFGMGNLLCPKTGERLISTELLPNISLENLIQRFFAEHGVSVSESRKENRDISRTILPGSKASAKAIKYLSEFLALRLNYGTSYQQNKAAYEIRLLAKSNLYNRSCLIEAGTILPLLMLLDSCDHVIQENAISALLKMSKQPAGQKEIIRNKGFNSIITVLGSGLKSECKQIAVATIFYLSSVHEHRIIMGQNKETIPALLELIENGTNRGKKNAVIAISVLLSYHRNRQRAISAGAVSVLLRLLASSDNAEFKTDVLGVLSTLADRFDGSVEILRASALSTILGLLWSIETKVGKEFCVLIIHSMCLNCGTDVLVILGKEKYLITLLYSLVTDCTSPGSRKSRSLIKILRKFHERCSSFCAIKDFMQEHYVD